MHTLCLVGAVGCHAMLGKSADIEPTGQLQHGSGAVLTALDTWSDASSETRSGLAG